MMKLEENPLFPTKAQLLGSWDKKPVQVVTNHFGLTLADGQYFNEWNILFIDKEDLELYAKNPEEVQEAVPSDSHILISEIKKANGKGIRDKLGSNFLFGMHLYSISNKTVDEDTLVFDNHPFYAMIASRLRKDINFEDLVKDIDEDYAKILIKFLDRSF